MDYWGAKNVDLHIKPNMLFSNTENNLGLDGNKQNSKMDYWGANNVNLHIRPNMLFSNTENNSSFVRNTKNTSKEINKLSY